MIRKVVIFALTLAASAVAGAGAWNLVRPYPEHIVHFTFPPPMPPGENWKPRPISVYVRMQDAKLFIGYRRVLDSPAPPRRRYVPQYRLFGYAYSVISVKVPSIVYFRLMKAWAPAWIVAPAFATYPTIAFIRGPVRRWRRRRRGECVACGYDLTGNVSGVCPECGAPVQRERADTTE